MVLLVHSFAFASLPIVFRFGWAGVDLFFVLSGYLVGLQAIQGIGNSSALRSFWTRRWTRTIPLYLVVLLVYVLVKPILGFPFQDRAWPYFFFLQNYFSPRDFGQSWSLCIEEQFYLLLPLLFFVWRRTIAPWFWVLVLATSVGFRLQIYLSQGGLNLADAAYQIQFPAHTHLDGLAAGLFLASTSKYWRAWSRRFSIIFAALGGLLLLVVPIFGNAELAGFSAVWMFTALGLGFAALLPLAYACPRPKFPGGGLVVEKIALWSYGIYLWNNLVFRAAERLPLPSALQMVVAWGFTFLLAALTYRWIELPGLRLRGRAV